MGRVDQGRCRPRVVETAVGAQDWRRLSLQNSSQLPKTLDATRPFAECFFDRELRQRSFRTLREPRRSARVEGRVPGGAPTSARRNPAESCMNAYGVSGAGESHPRALPKPCVNVSAHTAPITQPFTAPLASANEQTTPALFEQWPEASGLHGVGGDTACISLAPISPAVGSDSGRRVRVPIGSTSHSS